MTHKIEPHPKALPADLAVCCMKCWFATLYCSSPDTLKTIVYSGSDHTESLVVSATFDLLTTSERCCCDPEGPSSVPKANL